MKYTPEQKAAKSAQMSQSKYGGLTQSPLGNQTQVWEEFSRLANEINPDEAWSQLMTQYMRDWIQGMWIVQAIAKGETE